MNDSLSVKQYNRMTNTKIPKLILSLAIPAIISMLVTALYNMADTYFVGRLGPMATGAVGVVFSLQAIVQAVGFMLGMGAGSIISRLLGAKDNEGATIHGNVAFFSAIIFGIIYSISGIVFIDAFMRVLGASETILPYARDYASYILLGVPIIASSFVLNNLLRAEGKTTLSMIGLVTGAIINIGLDPIFINEWGLNLGISGAAIATIISQTISFCILLSFFVFKKTIVRISFRYLFNSPRYLFDIAKAGLPSFARQMLASFATIILNNQASLYGNDPAVAAISIATKLYMLVFSIALGMGQGFQPVVGYNYSSNHIKRVKESIIFTYLIMTLVLTLSGILCFVFSEGLVDLFVENSKEGGLETITIGSHILRYNTLVYPLLSLNVITNMTYQSIGMKWKSTLLSSFRQGLFFIPIIIFLPIALELFGVEIAQALSDLITFFATLPFSIIFIKKINKKIEVA